MSHRNLKYLNDHRIVYRRMPISDKPTIEATHWDHYVDGTYECYELFRSKAKITTFKSLKWHLLVLWYLNPDVDPDQFLYIAQHIADKRNGFISFKIPEDLLKKIVYEVSMLDLEEPPKNKMRKVIFKYGNGLCKEEKLRVVGELIGRTKKFNEGDVYDIMLMLNHGGWKSNCGSKCISNYTTTESCRCKPWISQTVIETEGCHGRNSCRYL